jgi:serine protease Do
MLEELREAARQVHDRVGPSVVGIGRGWGRGSGVVVAEGRVLTNAHNLRSEDVALTFSDGSTTLGRVAGLDAERDLAVIEADTGSARPIEWQTGATDTQAGAPVFAVANPGGRGLRVTFGLVSAAGRSFRGPRGRRIGGSIEHSVPLVRGSSGSPLVDPEGRLLGINTVRRGEGFCLAIAADESLEREVDALSRGEQPKRPRLGIAIAPPRVARRLRGAVGLPERDGVLVRAVEPGSPAADADIEKGDLIVEAGGRELTRTDELYAALDAIEPGSKLALTIVRGTDERSVEVAL